MDKKTFMQAALSNTRSLERPVPIVPFSDWDYYYTTDILSWKAEKAHRQKFQNVDVTTGFVTDLTSIPRLFWNVIPPTGPYAYAAIIHDFLYWKQPGSRTEADQIFKIAMDELKVPLHKSAPIYHAVRWFGQPSWKGNLAARNAGEKRILIRFPDRADISWSDWKKDPTVFGD